MHRVSDRCGQEPDHRPDRSGCRAAMERSRADPGPREGTARAGRREAPRDGPGPVESHRCLLGGPQESGHRAGHHRRGHPVGLPSGEGTGPFRPGHYRRGPHGAPGRRRDVPHVPGGCEGHQPQRAPHRPDGHAVPHDDGDHLRAGEPAQPHLLRGRRPRADRPRLPVPPGRQGHATGYRHQRPARPGRRVRPRRGRGPDGPGRPRRGRVCRDRRADPGQAQRPGLRQRHPARPARRRKPCRDGRPSRHGLRRDTR